MTTKFGSKNTRKRVFFVYQISVEMGGVEPPCKKVAETGLRCVARFLCLGSADMKRAKLRRAQAPVVHECAGTVAVATSDE